MFMSDSLIDDEHLLRYLAGTALFFVVLAILLLLTAIMASVVWGVSSALDWRGHRLSWQRWLAGGRSRR